MRSISFLKIAASTFVLLGSAVPLLRADINLGNVLCLGDSITDAFGGNGGYEPVLQADLNSAGYNFTFVGTQPIQGQPGGILQDGIPGEVISLTDPLDHLDNGLQGLGGLETDAPYFLSQLKSNNETPHFILLMIGTNDMLENFYPADAANRLGTLLSTLLTDDPIAHIIVSSIPPNTNNTPTNNSVNPNPGPSIPVNPLVLQYNAAIPAVIAAHQALGQNVSFVDSYTPIMADELANNRNDLADGTHPNQTGYNIIAGQFASGLEQSVPEPSSWSMVAAGFLTLVCLGRFAIKPLQSTGHVTRQ